VIGEVRKMQPGIGAGVSGNRSAVRQRFASADMLLELIYPYRHLRKARRLGGSGTWKLVPNVGRWWDRVRGRARAFYEYYRFKPTPTEPLHLYLFVKEIPGVPGKPRG